jgi:hypothetical protein
MIVRAAQVPRVTCPATHQPVLALVDTSPVLMLASTLACRERFDRPVHVSLAGPIQAEGAMDRVVRVLARHDIEAAVHPRAETLESTVTDWLAQIPGGNGGPLVDVSSASGGTATRAVLALERAVPQHYSLCWFNEANNEVHFSNGGLPNAHIIDIGSRRSVRSPITPGDFMAIFGLERAFDDPYCGSDRAHLAAIAGSVLRLAVDHPEPYREFRRVLAAARARSGCLIPSSAIPELVRPVIEQLADLDGWVRTDNGQVTFCGTSSTLSVFFLSGGWLELVVAEAIRRGLPEHHIQTNCGTTWGRKRRAEAEMDVAFVYKNALYLLSCKNDHLTDRFFPHLDRFRALIAEFGESRTRPVLLSTAELESRHIRRCDAYEIGQLSGRLLLDALARSLDDEPDHLLKALLTVSRGAPRAGIA